MPNSMVEAGEKWPANADTSMAVQAEGQPPGSPRTVVRELVRGFARWKTPLVIVVCVASMLANQALLQRTRELRNEIVQIRRSYTEPPIGTLLPPLTGTGINGEPITVRYGQGEKGTILLTVSKTCTYCSANWPDWRTLMEFDWFTQNRIVFPDLSEQVDANYFVRYGIPRATIIRKVDPSVRLAYNLRITPQTIFIGPDGRGKGVWSGLLSTDHLKEIVRVMTAYYVGER